MLSEATPADARFLNTGITFKPLRVIAAKLFVALNIVQESDRDTDSAIVFDDIVERHPDDVADAMKRAGHRAQLAY